MAIISGVDAIHNANPLVRRLGIEGISKSQVSELWGTVDEFRNRPLDTGPYTYL